MISMAYDVRNRVPIYSSKLSIRQAGILFLFSQSEYMMVLDQVYHEYCTEVVSIRTKKGIIYFELCKN